ncbi:MAG: thiol peroxidase [Desulfosalsimonas sp.]|uniref:thiol peroxidase n=1 Tax=Desulfosalsimonas sp. TaxID=3073848 RepID=UPI003970F0BC
MANITFKGNPVQTNGELPETGQQAPDFVLTKTDLTDLPLADLSGKKVILNIFPSIETMVCAESVRRFNEAAHSLDNTAVLCISRDLPFAHQRFVDKEGLDAVISLSELRSLDFGDRYGVRITDSALAGLLSRAVVVIDENGRVLYTQQVPEIGQEPDYETVLDAVRTMDKNTSFEDVCTKMPVGEHARFDDTDDACDDGRAGKI